MTEYSGGNIELSELDYLKHLLNQEKMKNDELIKLIVSKIHKIDNNLFKLSYFLDKIENICKSIKKPFLYFYNKFGNLREDEVSIHSSLG
tara:strand:- start:534 stop:803 length:270 start_codon:yes stop_codon:yes gene_type:complete